MKITVETKRVGERELTGLHSDAVSFDNADEENGKATVSGALQHNLGIGGPPTLFLRIEVDGVQLREAIDLRPLLQSWADGIKEEVRT